MSSDPSRLRFRLPGLSGPVLSLLLLLAVFFVLLAQRGRLGNFLSVYNLKLLMHTSAVNAIIALGMLLIIVSGGIDLSVGSVAALVTVATYQVYERTRVASESLPLASLLGILAGVGMGGLCGLFNGLVITRLRVAPFITTLGTMSMARGLAQWLNGRVAASIGGSTPGWIESLQRVGSDLLFFDPGVWIALLLALMLGLMMRNTVLGRHCYAIGSNELAARLCGVPVEWRKVWLYTLAGLLTGCGGILLFAYSASGDPNSGLGLELEVIAAVILGGASLSGGRGTVIGTLLGVFLLGVLSSMLVYLSVTIEVKNILLGAVVVVNVALSQWQRRDS